SRLGAGNLRPSPNIGGLGSAGSALNRNGAGSLSRATVGNVRPNIGSLGAHTGTGLNGNTLGARTGTTLNNHTLGNRTALGGLGQTGLRLNNGAQTSLRPNMSNAAINGRVTPQHLNNFLSINNGRTGIGAQTGVGARNGLNVSHLGGANANNIHHSFNHLNNTQLHNINNNLHNGFHNHHGFNNRGFGFNTFGFGFGSPFWNNWGLGVRGF